MYSMSQNHAFGTLRGEKTLKIADFCLNRVSNRQFERILLLTNSCGGFKLFGCLNVYS